VHAESNVFAKVVERDRKKREGKKDIAPYTENERWFLEFGFMIARKKLK
jgi:hypothetical protein